MTCPDCAAPVDPSQPACPRCGVNLLEAFEKKAWANQPAPKKRRKGVGLPSWLYILFATAAACAAGFFLAASRWPRPLPPQAYVDSARGFAVTPPNGWRVDSFEGSGPGEALRMTDEAATIIVTVLRAGTARAAVESQFSGNDIQIGGAETFSLDGTHAQRYAVTGGRTYMPSPNKGKRRGDLEAAAPEYESVEWAGELLVVPSGERDFAIKILSERSDFAKRRPVFDAFLASFKRLRPLDR
jgi:hypothetical protein